MSNKINHRRKHQRRRGNTLLTWYSFGGRRGTARGRRRWKRIGHRSLRRTGKVSTKVFAKGRHHRQARDWEQEER
jgi:hypothetical protein